MLSVKCKKIIAGAVVSSSVLLGTGIISTNILSNQKRIKALQVERELILSKNQALVNEKNSLTQEVDKLTTDITTLNKKEKEYIAKNQELQHKATELQNQTAELQNQKVELEKKSQSLQGEVANLTKEKTEVENKQQYLSDRVTYFENRNQQLVAENSTMADKLAAIEQQTKANTRDINLEKPKKVAIDIGHQLEHVDSGAHSSETNKDEDAMNLEVATFLKQKLEREGYQVIDVTPISATTTMESLKKRRETSIQNDVDLFVSIHFNSHSDGSAHGVEVYVPANPNDNLKKMSENILNGFKEDGYHIRGTKDGSKFAVLKTNVENAMLIECGFLTSPTDMSKYDPEKIADNIFEGIKSGI